MLIVLDFEQLLVLVIDEFLELKGSIFKEDNFVHVLVLVEAFGFFY
jgi:hypothetical protein